MNVLGGTVYYVNVLGGILCECIGRYNYINGKVCMKN